jgi:phosphoribosylanthranilate isomerase
LTKVKICGLTRAEDAVFATRLGAHFLGMVFHPGSRRAVSIETASRIAEAVRGASEGRVRPLLVGVFVDAGVEPILQTAEAVGLDVVQLHGNEPPREIDEIRHIDPARGMRGHLKVIKAFRVEDEAPNVAGFTADWLLFDSLAGGSGQSFSWSLLSGLSTPEPFFLAGGLTPENVGLAIRQAKPWGVDVASGVESAPGIKDQTRMTKFFAAVRSADGGGPFD